MPCSCLLALALPLLGLKTGMPGITVLPEDEQARQGYDMIADGFGPGGPGPIQVIVPADGDAQAVADQVMATEGIVMAFPPSPGMEGASIIQAVGAYDPSSDEALELIPTLRTELPDGVLVGGPVAENYRPRPDAVTEGAARDGSRPGARIHPAR